MAALSVGLEDARAAFDESVRGFVAAVDDCDEWDLLAASRCHGWSRLEVIDHVVAGWQEMLGGFAVPGDGAPTVDAASYWTAFAAETSGADPIEVLLAQRRRANAVRRPVALVRQLRDVAEVVLAASAALRPGPCRWQGHVFTAGDFLTIWAVEDVIHHLDLLLDAPPAGALTLARATVAALAPGALPAEWTDEDAVLAGSGRVRTSVDGLPVLG